MPREATQFKKGQSGNPGGRKKGFAARVRELVSPDEIIGVAKEILFDVDANKKDRIAAAIFLTDRGWGKAEQRVEISDGDGGIGRLDTGKLSDQELEKLQALIAKAMPKND